MTRYIQYSRRTYILMKSIYITVIRFNFYNNINIFYHTHTVACGGNRIGYRGAERPLQTAPKVIKRSYEQTALPDVRPFCRQKTSAASEN